MTAVWLLYSASLVAEVVGLLLGALDLSSRGRRLSEFSKPTVPQSPAWFNEHADLAEFLASLGLESVVQDQREVNNELIEALGAQLMYSKRVDDELGKLAGLGEGLGRLWVAAGLLLLGAILGGTANLLASWEG